MEMPTQIPAQAHAVVAYAEAQENQVTDLVVSDRGEFQLWTQRLRDVVTARNNLEEMRVSATGPMNDALRAINGWFRGPREKLEKVEKVLKHALGAFQLREQEKIRAEERAAQARAEQEAAELLHRAESAAKRGREERAEELRAKAASVVPAAPPTAPLKAAGMGFGVEWVYEVVNEAAVPVEYKTLDHAKIRGVVQALKGACNIPGIKVSSRPRVSAQGNRR